MSRAAVHRIILDVLELERELGRTPSQEEYEAKGKFGVYQAFQCQECGKWGAKKGSGNNTLSEIKKASLRGP